MRGDSRCLVYPYSIARACKFCAGPFLLPHLVTKDPLVWPIRHAAICLCDDLIEYASPVSYTLLPAMIPAVLDVLTTPQDPTLRQAAAYGVAVCAQYGGDAVTPHVKSLVDALVGAVTAPGAREGETENATDNCISALVRIALYRKGAPGVDVDALMTGAVSYLPIKADGVEARSIHGLAVEAMAKSKRLKKSRYRAHFALIFRLYSKSCTLSVNSAVDETWLGSGMNRLPLLLKGLAAGLVQHHLNTGSGEAGAAAEDDEDGTSGEELFTEATLSRLRSTLASVKASPYAAAFASVISTLSKKQQAALAHYDA